jgi:hypothetical protein
VLKPTYANVSFDVDIPDPTPTDSKGKLTITDLGKVILQPSENIACTFNVSAHLTMSLDVGIDGIAGLPDISAQFEHDWAYSITLGVAGLSSSHRLIVSPVIQIFLSCSTKPRNYRRLCSQRHHIKRWAYTQQGVNSCD